MYKLLAKKHTCIPSARMFCSLVLFILHDPFSSPFSLFSNEFDTNNNSWKYSSISCSYNSQWLLPFLDNGDSESELEQRGEEYVVDLSCPWDNIFPNQPLKLVFCFNFATITPSSSSMYPSSFSSFSLTNFPLHNMNSSQKSGFVRSM